MDRHPRCKKNLVRFQKISFPDPGHRLLRAAQRGSCLLRLLFHEHHVSPISLLIISFREISSGKQLLRQLPVSLINPEAFPSLLQVQVDVPAVHRGHTGGILRALHPALDLKGHNPGVHQIRNQPQCTDILRTEQILLRPLIDLFPVPHVGRLLIQVPGKTARLRATSPVAAPAADHAAHQTFSGITVAQSSMHKCFQLYICLLADQADLGKAQLPRKHNPLRAHFLQKPDTIRPCDSHLRGSMQRKIRKDLPQKTKDTEVLHEHCVHAMLIDRCKKLRQRLFQLMLLQQRVHCQVQLCAVKMTIIDRLKQLLCLRIFRKCACSEHAAASIDCIRSRIYRRADGVHASAWCQKFNHPTHEL